MQQQKQLNAFKCAIISTFNPRAIRAARHARQTRDLLSQLRVKIVESSVADRRPLAHAARRQSHPTHRSDYLPPYGQIAW